jgi:hypothetical protein
MAAWHRGCPVPISELRLVRLTYWGSDDRPHRGRLVLNRDAVRPVVAAMRSLYEARFPIRRMMLVDRYDADDDRSMAADNTSAFTCRRVEQTTSWSQHAYGARSTSIHARIRTSSAAAFCRRPDTRSSTARFNARE